MVSVKRVVSQSARTFDCYGPSTGRVRPTDDHGTLGTTPHSQHTAPRPRPSPPAPRARRLPVRYELVPTWRGERLLCVVTRKEVSVGVASGNAPRRTERPRLVRLYRPSVGAPQSSERR